MHIGTRFGTVQTKPVAQHIEGRIDFDFTFR